MPESNISPDAAAARRRLGAAVRRLAKETPFDRSGRVASALRDANGSMSGLRAALGSINPSLNYAEIAAELVEAWLAAPGHDGAALAFGFEIALEDRGVDGGTMEIVWTGPATSVVTARQTSAVVFGLIGEAVETLTMFSFASYHIAGLADVLHATAARGARIRLILETQADSGGKLSYDASVSLQSLANAAEFYTWPLDRRPHGALMHAKAIIVDKRAAFVTSANLTEFGIDRNLELGLLVRGGSAPHALALHIDHLIAEGDLRRV